MILMSSAAEVTPELDDAGPNVTSPDVSDHTVPAKTETRQARPSGATTKRIRWDYMIVFGAVHVAALLIFVPYFFSWAGVAAFCVSIVLFGILGIPIAFHRMLAHRSFKSPKWFERTLVTLAMCTAQETPTRWVAWHRKHHSHSDESRRSAFAARQFSVVALGLVASREH